MIINKLKGVTKHACDKAFMSPYNSTIPGCTVLIVTLAFLSCIFNEKKDKILIRKIVNFRTPMLL